MTSCKDHGEIGLDGAHLCVGVRSTQSRHDNVEHSELDFIRLLLEQAHGLWSITCQNDAIALGGQCRLNYFPKSRVIFGHQNGLCASCNFVAHRRCACLRGSGAGWKIDVEDSSSAKFAIHGKKTT